MNKTLLSTAIALAFGAASPTWANPTNTNDADSNGSIAQTAAVSPNQSSQTGAAANENSTANTGQQL